MLVMEIGEIDLVDKVLSLQLFHVHQLKVIFHSKYVSGRGFGCTMEWSCWW